MTAEERTRRDYIKLLVLQDSLRKLADTINTEITQTDIEWLNLIAIAKNKADPNAQQPQTRNEPEPEPKPGPSGIKCVIKEIRLPELILAPKINIHRSDEEEEDSDSS